MFTSPSPSVAGEVGERAGPVGHLDLQHRDAGAHRRLGREPQPGRLGLVERRLHVGAALPHDLVAQPAESLDVQVDRLGDRVRGSRAGCRSTAQGSEAASRVRSRKPPAASSRISGSPASSVAARLISAVDATCGRWLTKATSRSWRPGSRRTGRAPSEATHASSRVDRRRLAAVVRRDRPDDAVDHRRRRVLGPGSLAPAHRMAGHVPRPRRPSAQPAPIASPTTAVFTLPTSVTTASGATRRGSRPTSGAIVGIGRRHHDDVGADDGLVERRRGPRSRRGSPTRAARPRRSASHRRDASRRRARRPARSTCRSGRCRRPRLRRQARSSRSDSAPSR